MAPLKLKVSKDVDAGRVVSANQTIKLMQLAPGCKFFSAGLGWPAVSGHDLDFGMAVSDENRQMLGWITHLQEFWYAPSESNPALSRSADVVGGDDDKEGDDEVAFMDMDAIIASYPTAKYIDTIAFIYQASARKQTFADFTGDTYFRLDNGETGKALIRIELDDEFTNNCTLHVCQFVKTGPMWEITVIKLPCDPAKDIDPTDGSSKEYICYLFGQIGLKGWENIDPQH